MNGQTKTYVLIAGVAVLALLAGVAVWLTIIRPQRTPTTNTSEQPGTTDVPEETLDLSGVPVPTIQDADGDGLLDAEETATGTDPSVSDTDQDGLSDRAESNIYKSDPLVMDTDGDGVRDGAEVKAGTNPIGEGLLLDVRSAIDALTNETAQP